MEKKRIDDKNQMEVLLRKKKNCSRSTMDLETNSKTISLRPEICCFKYNNTKKKKKMKTNAINVRKYYYIFYVSDT